MTESKYGKYLLTNPIGRTPHTKVVAPMLIMAGEKHWPGARLSLRMNTITEPFEMVNKPHFHPYDAYMGFIGGDTQNFGEFDAEVELALGEEMEVQHINRTTIVYVPKGLYHCPLVFKRVDKPIVFMHIFPESEYERKDVDQ
jgi:hypothetical protein